MKKVCYALLAAGTLMLGTEQALAEEAECGDELDPSALEEADSLTLQCLKEDVEYATVTCASADDDEVVSCNYEVSDPGDFCASAIACDVDFLNDDEEVVDHVYIEEGAGEFAGQWLKLRIACGCPEWR